MTDCELCEAGRKRFCRECGAPDDPGRLPRWIHTRGISSVLDFHAFDPIHKVHDDDDGVWTFPCPKD
jgi:hypothetical protein